jgi:hypothetical protein
MSGFWIAVTYVSPYSDNSADKGYIIEEEEEEFLNIFFSWKKVV